jgi:hypothetical protein
MAINIHFCFGIGGNSIISDDVLPPLLVLTRRRADILFVPLGAGAISKYQLFSTLIIDLKSP